MENIKDCLQKLKDSGLKVTPQRLAIVKILEGNTCHPSADKIYNKVKKKYPMISFATVYKTLKVLAEIGEIQQLKIVEKKVNFDPNTDPHNHFFCKKCREIRDVFPGKKINLKEIDGHLIEKYQVYFYGICSKCRKQN